MGASSNKYQINSDVSSRILNLPYEYVCFYIANKHIRCANKLTFRVVGSFLYCNIEERRKTSSSKPTAVLAVRDSGNDEEKKPVRG
jgi:hypothetical protein